jgi:hypothetical protein
MNAANVTRLLTYLEQLKASGEEDKWEMSEYLADREDHDVLFPHEVTNWHCGTAGCLAGSWAIINVRDGGEKDATVSSKAEVLLTIALVLAGFYLFVPSLRNLPSGSTRSSTSLTLTLPGLRNLSVRLLQ